MNPNPLDHPRRYDWHGLFFPDDFEICWAGPVDGPTADSKWCCVGSTDGRSYLMKIVGPPHHFGILDEPAQFPGKSKEAINGIAESEGRLAVSTRSEMLTSDGVGRQGIIPIGAHGVEAMPGGRFVAACGPLGLTLIAGGRSGVFTETYKSMAGGQPRYVYRAVPLPQQSGLDVIACACRGEGILFFTRNTATGKVRFLSMKYPGVDVVDVCVVRHGDQVLPIALGRDGMLITLPDPLAGGRGLSMKWDEPRGVAFRLLASQGHLFVLTSREFFAFPQLGELLVKNAVTPGYRPPMIIGPPIEDVVDICLLSDNIIAMIRTDENRLAFAYIDQLVSLMESRVESYGSPDRPLQAPERTWEDAADVSPQLVKMV